MPKVYVAAGSNVDPVRNLRKVIDVLTGSYAPLEVSPAYRNPAVGFQGDDFINLVIGFTTDNPLPVVIGKLQEAEAICGRERNAPKWAPRVMDLDILLYDDLILDQPGLKLPRPDLVRRAYMLQPMVDLAPDLVHPSLGITLEVLWKHMQSEGHPMSRVDLS